MHVFCGVNNAPESLWEGEGEQSSICTWHLRNLYKGRFTRLSKNRFTRLSKTDLPDFLKMNFIESFKQTAFFAFTVSWDVF